MYLQGLLDGWYGILEVWDLGLASDSTPSVFDHYVDDTQYQDKRGIRLRLPEKSLAPQG